MADGVNRKEKLFSMLCSKQFFRNKKQEKSETCAQ